MSHPPLIVQPHDGPYRASLTDMSDGVIVRFSRDDRPRGQRLISIVTIDAPMHCVVDAIHAELARLNRGYERRHASFP